MIAVFCKNKRILWDLKMIPKDNFIIIKSHHDIHGRHFTGIIITYAWHEDEFLRRAYDLLKIRQPELFKDT